MAEQRKRQTAYRLCISQILNNEQSQDNASVFVSLKNKNNEEINASKINLIANVIDKYSSSGERKYATVTLDDATGQIRIKSFGEDVSKLERVEIGDIIVVIGFLRIYNDELYIFPDIVRIADPKWLFVRKLELTKQFGEIEESNEVYSSEDSAVKMQESRNAENQSHLEVTEEKLAVDPASKEELKDISALENMKKKIVEKIKMKGDEIDIEELIIDLAEPIEQLNSSINELLESNTLYEPKPGTLKLL